MEEKNIKSWLLNFEGNIKKIKGYDYYYITDNGDVYSTLYKNIIKRKLSYKNSSRSPVITLMTKGISSTMHVHHLVYTNFTGKKITKKEWIMHIDGSLTNNNIDNLKKVLAQKVIKDQFNNGRKQSVTSRKLSDEDIKKIKLNCKKYNGYGMNTFIAKKFNVTPSLISCIRCGKIWKDIKL